LIGIVHEVAAVKVKRSFLFSFCEDSGPHYFCWAVQDFKITVIVLSQMKKFLHLICFGLYITQEGA